MGQNKYLSDLQNIEVVEDTIASVKAYRKNSFNSKLALVSTVD